MPGADRRHTARPGYGRAGTLRIADAPPSEVVVDDLSRDGCRIQTALPLKPDMAVAIGVAGVGIIAARVVWHGPEGYGCAFDNRLPAGSITAAFSPTNIRHLELSPDRPSEGDVFFSTETVKWPVGRRTLAIGVLAAGSWAILGALAFAITR